MESLFARHLISATHHTFPSRYPLIPTRSRRIDTRIRHFRFLLYFKLSDFLDFQGYAKPSRLLPATEVDVCTDSSTEKVVTSSKLGGSESLFKVKLSTSSMCGSGLSDLNAGILLCLIDENRDSILQRISASSMRDYTMQSEEKVVSDVLHFQRASVDEFTFEGPKLGKIEALWISLESGQWRLGGVSLTVMWQCQHPTEANDRKEFQYNALQYNFEDDDILLGEGCDISMVELRPRLVTEFSGENLSLLSKNLLQSTSLASHVISNEESMREYANLKSSLLFYDALLILAGSSVASFSAGENAAFAFLIGGFGGFLYLLFLQRSVDGLPARASTTTMNRRGNFNETFGRLKSPSSLVLALLFAIIAVKYGSGDGALLLTPKEVVSGMVGFLACKVAVVLAAFKPMPLSPKENE